jgi:hypothetical protein
MDKVFTKTEVARMLKLDREAVIRLQALGRLDRVDTSKIEGGVSRASLDAFLGGKVATFDRTLRRGTPRGV